MDKTKLKSSGDNLPHAPNDGVLNCAKLNSCLDGLRPFLGPSLEKRVRSMLEEFICKSDSRYARRFPCVKKFFDAVAAWGDCLDTSYKEDVRKEMIKHAIEYLVKDGLVTQFGDAALNNGTNIGDPDSLANEQGALKNMNVLRFINEKDYWLCQDCVATASAEPSSSPQIRQFRRETSSSDLDVEVGSISQDSTLYCTCRSNSVYDPCCNKYNENAESASNRVEDRRNFQLILEPNKNALNARKGISSKACAFDNPSGNCSPRIENCGNSRTRQDCDCNTEIPSKKPAHTQTSCQGLTFVFNPTRRARTPLHCSQEISNVLIIPEAYPRRGSSKKVDAATMRDCKEKTKAGKFVETQTCHRDAKIDDRKFLQTQTSDHIANAKGGCSVQTQTSDHNANTKSGRVVQTQTSRQDLTFTFEPIRNNLSNPSEEARSCFNNPKPQPRRGYIKKSDVTAIKSERYSPNGSVHAKASKLKVYVHKATGTSCSKLRNPPKASNLSLPCKSNQLIVRLFEADPSLSDSCLILMRKKFEKDIGNACSCVNDITKRLDESAIKKLCLDCEIRPGRVDLKLVTRDGGISKVRWFLARVPTCSNVHKRESCHGGRESGESIENQCGAECSKDLPVDPCCCKDVTSRGQEFEEPPVAFYSVCSNYDLPGGKRSWTAGKNEIGEGRTDNEVNFIWSNRREEQMDFVFSSRSMNLGRNGEDSAISTEVYGEERYDHLAKVGGTAFNREGELKILNEGRGEFSRENYKRNETYVDEKLERNNVKNYGKSRGGNFPDENVIVSCNCKCGYSSDSLKENAYREDNSPMGGCNPSQCFCHIFCTNDNLSGGKLCTDENAAHVINLRIENFDEEEQRMDGLCHLGEDTAGLQASVMQKAEECACNVECSVRTSLAKDIFIFEGEGKGPKGEGDIFESKNVTSQTESKLKLETNIFYRKESKKSTLEVREIYSEDSIRVLTSNSNFTDVSCDSKCSCCGEDLLNPSFETKEANVIENKNPTKGDKASEMISNKTELKIHETLNLASKTGKATSEAIGSGDVQDSTRTKSSRFKVSPNIVAKNRTCESSIMSSASKQISRVINGDAGEIPCERAEDSEQSAIEQSYQGNICKESTLIVNREPTGASKFSSEKNPGITEPLFVFCRRSNVKQTSSFASNFSSDEEDEGSSSQSIRRRIKKTGQKFVSPCRLQHPAATVKSCRRKSIYSTTCGPSCSSKPLSVPRIDSKKHASRHKVKGEDGAPMSSRYRSRLWRGSMVPGSLCGSFPAIDRIKYLIRKKLRKLLLEERDKGTSTSKTFLRNDRYLVSISSGKLNEGRIIRDSCSAGSSIRCPFTTRNRYEQRGAPEKTFTEGCRNVFGDTKARNIFANTAKARNDFRNSIKERYQKMVHGNDILKKMRLAEVSKSLDRRCDSKSTDTQELIERQNKILRKSKVKEGRSKEKFATDCKVQRNRSSVESLTSRGVIFIEDHGDHFLNRKSCPRRNRNSRENRNLEKNSNKHGVNSSLNSSNHRNHHLSILSLNSGRVVFFEDHGDNCLNQFRKSHAGKVRDLKENRNLNKNHNFKENVDCNAKNYTADTKPVSRSYSKRNHYKCDSSGSSFQGKINRRRMEVEERTCCDKLKSFEKRLFKLERKREEDNNFASFLSDYEKRINELDADFRLKLLQYVALCRSVKNSLMKRLQSDDVYEVSSSSV